MPAAKRRVKKVAAEFSTVLAFIKRYSLLPTEADYLIATVWAMGTWTFSPACGAMPFTYPYLYVTGAKGSGKSRLGLEVYQYITRNHRAVVDVTGPAMFRMLGDYDDESGEIIPHYPTLGIDEIDATYSGNKNEGLRGPINAGYKVGSTVPRSAGKRSIQFPVYSPKCLMGIDNGHLPDTVVDRCIRINVEKAPAGQEPDDLYPWDVQEESAEIQQALSDWAKRECMVLRDYRPAKPEGLTGRQWEMARSLIQLAHAIGNEREVTAAVIEVMNRKPALSNERKDVFAAIAELFATMPDEHADRLFSRQITQWLSEHGVVVGTGGHGSQITLSNILDSEGIPCDWIRVRPGHPGIKAPDKLTGRGYYRRHFDEVFVKYLPQDEDED